MPLLEARVGFKESVFEQLSPFLGTCGYHFLPQKERIRPKDIKKGERDDRIKFVKNLSSESHWPRFEIAVTPPEDGRRSIMVNLHLDRGPHRVFKGSVHLIFEEGTWILAQLANFKIVPPEVMIFQKALNDFLLFGNARSVGEWKKLEGATLEKRLSNWRRKRHQRSWETGWRKQKKLKARSDFIEEDF